MSILSVFLNHTKKKLVSELPAVRQVLAEEVISAVSALPTPVYATDARTFAMSALNNAFKAVEERFPIIAVVEPILKPILGRAITQVSTAENLDQFKAILINKLVQIIDPADAQTLIAARSALLQTLTG